MKHVKLFESFNYIDRIESMIMELKKDPKMGHYNFSIDSSDADTPFLVWNNPSDDREWRNSGYADDYNGNFSNVKPMYVLSFLHRKGKIFAYKLTSEEKYYEAVIEPYSTSQMVRLGSTEDLKKAFFESLWSME